MSPRIPSTQGGRPIVAELGRPETAQETADRKAASSLRHRTNQTTRNLVLALLASLAIVAFLVIVVVRPDSSTREPVDYAGVASEAQGAVDQHLVVPRLPEGWSANRAEFEGAAADGVDAWRIGFLTPGSQYIGLAQGLDADSGWVADQLDRTRASGTVRYGGVEWTVYDRRDAKDPGNLAYSLSAEIGASSYVLSGTAVDEEFQLLAEAVVSDAEGAAP